MRCFHIDKNSLQDNKIHLRADKARHAFRAARMKKGELVVLFDNEGGRYEGFVETVCRESGTIQVEKSSRVTSERPWISLYCAIPKNDKFSDIVNVATQLGADRIVPLISERVVFRQREQKPERWQTIAREAAQQCCRPFIPQIGPVREFPAALNDAAGCDLKIMGACTGPRHSFRSVLDKSAKRVAVFIGPEGDFSPDEVAAARNKGFSIITLGPRRLRCATAALFIMTVLDYELKS